MFSLTALLCISLLIPFAVLVYNNKRSKEERIRFKDFYFSFNGTVGRKEYFFYYVPLLLPLFCAILAGLFFSIAPLIPYMAVSLIILVSSGLFLVTSTLAVNTKRFRDIGVSPWWQILFYLLIPVFAFAWVVLLLPYGLKGGYGDTAFLVMLSPIPAFILVSVIIGLIKGRSA